MTSRLKQARIDAQLSIEEVSRRLNIRKHYLIALEEENLNEIPASVYAQGYRKMYEKLLGLEKEFHEHNEAHKSDSYSNILDFKNKNSLSLGITTMLLIILIAFIYLVSFSSQYNKTGIIQNLENIEASNYMMNVATPKIQNISYENRKNAIIEIKFPNIDGTLDESSK